MFNGFSITRSLICAFVCIFRWRTTHSYPLISFRKEKNEMDRNKDKWKTRVDVQHQYSCCVFIWWKWCNTLYRHSSYMLEEYHLCVCVEFFLFHFFFFWIYGLRIRHFDKIRMSVDETNRWWVCGNIIM